MARAAQLRPVVGCGANGITPLRNHGTTTERRGVWCGRTRSLRRQRTKRTLHATDKTGDGCIENLDYGTRRRPIFFPLSEQQWRSSQCRCGATPGRQTRRSRPTHLSLTCEKARDSACAASYRSDGVAPSWRGSSVDRHWLGHESLDTTQIYLDANLQLKEAILAKMNPPKSKPGRYRPDDQLLSYLKSL